MLTTTLSLLLFLFPLAYSPGPGNLFFAANGARFGFRATIPASPGYHTATWLVTAAIGFGFLGVTRQLPQLFTLLGDALAGVFRSGQSAAMLNMFFGATLAGVAVWMLFS